MKPSAIRYPAPVVDYAIGDTVADKYRILSLLGSGGSGHTYAAQAADGTKVAIKVLSLRGLSDWKLFELFEREARVLGSLDHPMIPRYVDDFSEETPDGPQYCIVQELAPGQTLQASVEGGWRGSEDDIRSIAERILGALVYLHGRMPPVIHRDLKPLNILRDEGGKISVVDFGSVRDRIHTTVGGGSTMVGTFGYMAPEQLRGQAEPTTDLYGLAATLVFLITGHSPSDLPTKRLKVEFRGHANVSAPFAAWLDRMLEPAPEDRFPSAQLALDALQNRTALVQAPPVAAVPVSSAPAASRNPAPFIALTALLLVTAGGAAAWLMYSVDEPPQPAHVDATVYPPPTPPVPVLPVEAPEPAEPETPQDAPQDARWWPKPTHPSLDGPLDLLWATEIGLTTYRSTIHVWKDRIVVNSNGATRADLDDMRDGVYVLGFDGSTKLHIEPPGEGETDSNGVAVADAGLFFGTDQDVLYHYDWGGKLMWQQKLDGDAEAPPALADFDGDGVLDVAVSSEAGTFYLLDGRDGSIRGQVSAGEGEYGQTGFAGAPALFDVNADGVLDVLVPARDQLFRAIDGKSGDTLWTHRGESGMHSSPLLVNLDTSDAEPELVFTEAYSRVYAADPANGAILWTTELEHPGGGIEGIFAPVGYYPDARCVLIATAWWGEREGVYCLDQETGRKRWRHEEPRKNISSGSIVADVDPKKKGNEALFGTESGFLVALDTKGREVLRQGVGGSVECTPTAADLDGDGTTDVLVASGDGKLYAFSTGGVAPAPGSVGGYVRVDPSNTGVWP